MRCQVIQECLPLDHGKGKPLFCIIITYLLIFNSLSLLSFCCYINSPSQTPLTNCSRPSPIYVETANCCQVFFSRWKKYLIPITCLCTQLAPWCSGPLFNFSLPLGVRLLPWSPAPHHSKGVVMQNELTMQMCLVLLIRNYRAYDRYRQVL